VPNNFIQINITAPNAENIEMEFNDKIQKNTELIYKIKWKWLIEQMAKILTVFFSASGAVPKRVGYTSV
jgi:hypothetical protein